MSVAKVTVGCAAGYACKAANRCRLDNRVLVQIACASHALIKETCSGASCAPERNPHVRIARNIIDWIWSGLIFASPGSDHGAFLVSAVDWENQHVDEPYAFDEQPLAE